MIEVNYRFDLISMVLFLGICQGIFLSIFFLTKRDNSNKYLGVLLLSFSLMILDYFLCYTYLMIHSVWILNYSESITFLVGPLVYLHVKNRITNKNNKDLLHFIPFLFYLLYYLIYLAQPFESKYNSYLDCWNINLSKFNTTIVYNADPLAIGKKFMFIILTHLLIYVTLTLVLIVKFKSKKQISLLETNDSNLKWIRDISVAFTLCVVAIVIINAINPCCTQVVPISIVLSLFIYFVSFRIIVTSTFFGLTSPRIKYSNSGVSQNEKQAVYNRLFELFENEKIYMDNLISLPKLSKIIGQSVNVVSQVINEKFGMSFFELIAKYRIDEAKSILADKKNENLTIIEVGEMVGYNSKSSFNQVFKKLAGITPSEYKKQNT